MDTTKMTDIEFFGNHVNTDICGLEGIKECLEREDIDGASHVFAEYIRKVFRGRFDIASARQSLLPSAESIRREAERVKGHTLVSCRVPYTFGEKIDWTLNPTYNGYKEWPWVLNRHFDWEHLARYYIVSGDESYAKEWAEQLLGWLVQAQCPTDIIEGGSIQPTFCERMCWRNLEAAIRMNVWLYLISVFAHSSIGDEVIVAFFKSICEHAGILLKTRSERNFILQEMGSLAVVGFEYPFLKESAHWLSFANARLEKEVDVQVYPDGMHYEMTVHYHKDCMYNYYKVYNMYAREGKTPPEYTFKALERMFGAYVKMARPDFFCPTMNDGDGVNADIVMRNAVKVFPEREDFKYFATGRKEGKAPDFNSCFMEYSGIVAMRSDWSERAVWAYMDASPLGYGHHHDDRNNIQLYAYGKELIPEAGNFDYDTSEMRRYVTSSRGHNCSRMDGLDQNMRKSYVRRPGVTSVKSDSRWFSSEVRDIAESDYVYGYGEDELLYVDWTRKLIFLKKEEGLAPFFVSVDRFKAKDNNAHDYELIWHMHDNPTTLFNNNVVNEYDNGVGVSLSASFGTVSVVRGMKSPVFQGWLPNFGVGDVEHYPIPTALNTGRFTGECRVVTVIEPYECGERKIASVRASSSYEDRSFTLVLKDGREIVLGE